MTPRSPSKTSTDTSNTARKPKTRSCTAPRKSLLQPRFRCSAFASRSCRCSDAGGVAGYLFRPLAEAVVFALIASYILSQTLVPTMANYLLRNQVHHSGPTSEQEGRPARNAQPPRRHNKLIRFQHGFERGFEAVRGVYRGLLQMCLRNHFKFIGAFMGFSLLSFGLAPYLGHDFFPAGAAVRIELHAQ